MKQRISERVNELHLDQMSVQKEIAIEKAAQGKEEVGIFKFSHQRLVNAEETVLNSAKIVFATLSGSGSDRLSRIPGGFHTVIIDEAAQAVELSTLIPLRYNCKHCILIGDPRQLPATVFSRAASKSLYTRSLFSRLQRLKHPLHLLTVQYRMHP